MTPIFKPGYVYRCVWKHNPDFYYINYMFPEQPESGVVCGMCVGSNDTDYLVSTSTHTDPHKWTLERVPHAAHLITELGHINDFPEYLI